MKEEGKGGGGGSTEEPLAVFAAIVDRTRVIGIEKRCILRSRLMEMGMISKCQTSKRKEEEKVKMEEMEKEEEKEKERRRRKRRRKVEERGPSSFRGHSGRPYPTEADQSPRQKIACPRRYIYQNTKRKSSENRKEKVMIKLKIL